MSGLEFMQGILDGDISQPPLSAGMNYHLAEVSPGLAVFHGCPDFQQTNPMGAVHGGWYGTLLDSAMSCAVMTVTPKGSVYTTLEFKVNIMRALPLGREVSAEGVVAHGGRSTGIATGEIRDLETGKLYANGTATCIIMDMSAS